MFLATFVGLTSLAFASTCSASSLLSRPFFFVLWLLDLVWMGQVNMV